VEEYMEILGIQVPTLTMPVRPGRNLAIIVEVAAMNNRQRKMGYNAAKVLNDRVMGEISKNSDE
jgi:HPr kinase/phosphorylase